MNRRRGPSPFNRARRLTSRATIVLGDANAIYQGKAGQRIANRIIGRLIGSAARHAWRNSR